VAVGGRTGYIGGLERLLFVVEYAAFSLTRAGHGAVGLTQDRVAGTMGLENIWDKDYERKDDLMY
jgi:hypothetical protein